MSAALDAIAALLMLVGAAFVLLAAIGVARLPDIFVRMHAATKAGVLGVGLLLLGTAAAFGDAGVWGRAVVAITFLVVTTPIAAHALARAAYAAGAPLWRGTIADHLSRTGDRKVAAFGRIGGRAAAATVPGSEETPMTILPFDDKKRGALQAAAPETRIGRILVGLVPGDDGRAHLRHAVDLARETGAELVGLSIVDVPAIRRVGPVPAGGIGWARQLSDHRIQLARDRAAAAVTGFETEAAQARVRYAVRHEEGDPARLLAGLAPAFDLVVMPPHHDVAAGSGEARPERIDDLLRAGVRPILTGPAPRRDVRNLLFVHGDGPRGRDMLRWFAHTRLWPDATVHVAGTGDVAATAAAHEECTAYLRAHGYAVESLGRLPDAGAEADALSGLRFRCDAVVIGKADEGGWFRSWAGGGPARRLRGADCPVLIG